MKYPIRIAHIIGKAVNGGTETVAMNYYKNIDKKKFQFDFFVESTSKVIDRDYIEKNGGRIYIIPSYKHIIKYVKTLKKIFRSNKYYIVHSHMNSLSFICLKIAKCCDIPIRIAHSHSTTSKNEPLRNLLKLFFRKFSTKYSTDYFACSNKAGIWLFGKKYIENGFLLKNAINDKKFSFSLEKRKEVRNELKLNDEILLGNVGRLAKQKNQIFLLKLLKELIKVGFEGKLLIIGEGDQKEKLLKYCHKNGILDYVIFHQPVENIEDYYSAMDIFLFPSLYEGLGISLIEAQINGLHCVVNCDLPVSEATINEKCVHPLRLEKDNWVSFVNENKNIRREKNVIIPMDFDISNQGAVLQKKYERLLSERTNE